MCIRDRGDIMQIIKIDSLLLINDYYGDSLLTVFLSLIHISPARPYAACRSSFFSRGLPVPAGCPFFPLPRTPLPQRPRMESPVPHPYRRILPNRVPSWVFPTTRRGRARDYGCSFCLRFRIPPFSFFSVFQSVHFSLYMDFSWLILWARSTRLPGCRKQIKR